MSDAIDNDTMTITLSSPVGNGAAAISSITVREPRVREVLKADRELPKDITPQAMALYSETLLQACTGLAPDVLASLPIRPFNEAERFVMKFTAYEEAFDDGNEEGHFAKEIPDAEVWDMPLDPPIAWQGTEYSSLPYVSQPSQRCGRQRA